MRRPHHRPICAAWLLPAMVALALSAGADVTIRARLALPEGAGNPADWSLLATERIAAVPPDGAEAVTPAADGSFTLDLPEVGRWYLCPYYRGKLAPDALQPLRVTPAVEVPADLELTPEAPRSHVVFTVQDAEGTPVAGARVHLLNEYGQLDADDGATTGKAGSQVYEDVPCGRYALWVEATAPLAASLFRSLDVTPGEGAQEYELQVPASAAVRGRLVEADGTTPAAGYTVAVQTGTVPDDEVGRPASPAGYARGALDCYTQALTADDGTFELTGLTARPHALDIRKPGEADAWGSIDTPRLTAGETADLGEIRVAPVGWQQLFDRRTLDGWAESDFYGKREVRLQNDRIILSEGRDMTGVTWERELPRINFEVTLQAMRVQGGDFFCGLTFPVEDSFCSLILGGWGGGMVGLSSLDGFDASENDTSSWRTFENGRWYRVRLRVTADNITAWIDSAKVVDVDITNRALSTRFEVEASKPFGVATWCTTGAIRDFRLRAIKSPLPPGDN